MSSPRTMAGTLKLICQKILVVVGASLLVFPNGVLWYWGNLSVLTLSYFVSKLDQMSGVETPWVVSLYIIFRVLGLLTYDVSKRICGKQLLLIIGMVISDTALFFCYFAIQNSLVLINAAMGICQGFGSGLLFGDALHTVVNMTDKHVGLFTSIIQGSFALGAIIINLFVTLYVNPENLSPDLHLDFSSYFSQKEVLDRVPDAFLFIGTFSIASHALALAFLNLHLCGKDIGVTTKIRKNESISGEASTTSSYLAIDTSRDESTSSTTHGSSNVMGIQKDYTPKEMLKTVAFISMWFAYFVGDFPLLLAINYYKSFGQIWIKDDYFLTALGTTILFVNAWLRGVWGLVIDRIGPKSTLILILAPLVVIAVWFCFSVMFNKWIYFITAFLFSSLSAALYSVFPAVMVLVFGKTHFSVNYGLINTASVLFNIVGPIGLEAILSHYGWFVTYSSSAILDTVALVLLLKYVPPKSDS